MGWRAIDRAPSWLALRAKLWRLSRWNSSPSLVQRIAEAHGKQKLEQFLRDARDRHGLKRGEIRKGTMPTAPARFVFVCAGLLLGGCGRSSLPTGPSEACRANPQASGCPQPVDLTLRDIRGTTEAGKWNSVEVGRDLGPGTLKASLLIQPGPQDGATVILAFMEDRPNSAPCDLVLGTIPPRCLVIIARTGESERMANPQTLEARLDLTQSKHVAWIPTATVTLSGLITFARDR
jgi:hypothetical protein